MKKKEHLDIGDPIPPRQRKLPKKLDEPDTYHFPSTPKVFLFPHLCQLARTISENIQ